MALAASDCVCMIPGNRFGSQTADAAARLRQTRITNDKEICECTGGALKYS